MSTLTHEAAQGSESGILSLKKDIKAQQFCLFVCFAGTCFKEKLLHPHFIYGIKVNEQSSWYQSKGQTCVDVDIS